MVSGVPDISDSEYGAFVTLVYDRCGITLGAGKKMLVTTRLAREKNWWCWW